MPSDFDDCPGLSPDIEHAISADPALIAQGWVRRYLADPDRAQEAVELYSALGYEVKAQKLSPEDFGTACHDCASTICHSYVMIYTRGPSVDKPPDR